MEINTQMKVYTLLKEYPQIEKYLVELSPRYKKLKNPILRRTVARIATLKQAAMIGGFSSSVFVNLLRVKMGQQEIDIVDEDIEILDSKPLWAEEKPKIIINATQMLDDSKNPLSEINKRVKKLKAKEVILLQSDFIPAPLIDEMLKKGFTTASLSSSKDGWYDTYITL